MYDDLFYSLDYHLCDPDGQRRRFASQVRATPETVEAVIAARNLGEFGSKTTLPFNAPPKDWCLAKMIEADGFAPHVLHMACFVGFVAIKSGVATVEDILGDCGLVHEIAHNLDIGEGEPLIATRANLVEMARRIERAIPGYPLTPSTFRP